MVKFIVKKHCLLEFSFPCPYLWQEIVDLSKVLEIEDQKKIIISQIARLMPKEYINYEDRYKWWFSNQIHNTEQGFNWFSSSNRNWLGESDYYPILTERWTERLIVPSRQNERIVKYSWTTEDTGRRYFKYYPNRFRVVLKSGKLSKRFCDAVPY